MLCMVTRLSANFTSVAAYVHGPMVAATHGAGGLTSCQEGTWGMGWGGDLGV